MTIQVDTLDDLLHEAISFVVKDGHTVTPSKGTCHEVVGVKMVLTDPTHRFSSTVSRGKLTSALAETLWYLSGSSKLKPIEQYIPFYRGLRKGQHVWGAYGPRLCGRSGAFQKAIRQLEEKPDTRQAVIPILRTEDLTTRNRNPPCTIALQLFNRDQHLDMLAYMRSNDIWLGLPHDIFAFTFIQELAARHLGLALGSYTHLVGSLHLYEKDYPAAMRYLDEGYQPTTRMFDDMPSEGVFLELGRLIAAEAAIRRGRRPPTPSKHPYWNDLQHILLEFQLRKGGSANSIDLSSIHSPTIKRYLEEMRTVTND